MHQRSLAAPVALSGVGLHSGEAVTLRVLPAPAGSGISFLRTDLPGRPRIRAIAPNIEPSLRCTSISEAGVRVHTIEHLMAALYAAGIDNALIEIDGEELPAAGGSSMAYVELIQKVGWTDLKERAPSIQLDHPLYFSEGRSHLVALPAEEFRVSYTLHYPDCAAIRSQYYSLRVDWPSFVEQLACCRTFARFEELEELKRAGLIRGASLESAIVIKDGALLTEGGVHFDDEPVRHKVLDLIGDLALIGTRVQMHIMAICSGHRTNGALAKAIFNHITRE